MTEANTELAFDDLGKESLQELANEKNEGLSEDDPGYIDLEQDEDKLAEELAKAEQISDGRINVESSKILQNIPFDDLCMSDDNYRYDTDYFDPDLKSGIIDEGGIRNPLVVTPKDNEEDKYEILSGHRRFFNYLEALEDGLNLEDEVPCLVRETEGTSKEKKIDKILTIWQSNETLDPSIIQKMEVMSDLEEMGMSRTAIANKMGCSRSYVTQLLKLEHLPERVKELVHYEYTSDHLIAQGQQHLIQNNVPFVEDDNGDIEILGISYNNAKVLCSLYPKPSHQDFEDEKEDVNKFIKDRSLEFVYDGETEDGGAISAAQLMATKDFEPVVDNLKAQSDVFEDVGEDNADYSDQEGSDASDADTTSDDAEGDQDEDQEQSTQSDSETSEQEASVEDLSASNVDMTELAMEIEQGEIILADDWKDQLTDNLLMEEDEAGVAANLLLELGILYRPEKI